MEKFVFSLVFHAEMTLSQAEKTAIITLKRENKTNREIIAHLWDHYGKKVDRRTVQRTWSRLRESGITANTVTRRSKFSCSERSQRTIRRLALSNRFDSLNTLTEKANLALPSPISHYTLRRALQKQGLKRHIAKRCPLLTAAQRKKRVLWAKAHSTWPRCNWSRVLFTDEKIFRNSNNRKGVFVTRSPGEKLRPDCVAGSVKRGVQAHVWGAIGWYGAAPLKRVVGNLNAQEYQNQILVDIKNLGKNFAGKKQGWFFQQDLAPCHNARSTQRFLADRGITVLPWAGNSPDLNPIENVWGWVQNRLPRDLPHNEMELFERIQAVWSTIPRTYIRTLISSLPNRVAAVLESKGGPTDY